MEPRIAAITDAGFDVHKVKIKSVRISPYRNKWYVEYRLDKPRFIIDHWWWYDDSIHSNYCDALVRANVLSSLGYFEVYKKKKQHSIEFKVKG